MGSLVRDYTTSEAYRLPLESQATVTLCLVALTMSIPSPSHTACLL